MKGELKMLISYLQIRAGRGFGTWTNIIWKRIPPFRVISNETTNEAVIKRCRRLSPNDFARQKKQYFPSRVNIIYCEKKSSYKNVIEMKKWFEDKLIQVCHHRALHLFTCQCLFEFEEPLDFLEIPPTTGFSSSARIIKITHRYAVWRFVRKSVLSLAKIASSCCLSLLNAATHDDQSPFVNQNLTSVEAWFQLSNIRRKQIQR